jgi:hypothetical protein
MHNRISWADNAMVTVIPQHKSDQQEGTRSLPKHVNANKAEPSICQILSFGI